jgi:alpha/beta superfamily hydrolase
MNSHTERLQLQGAAGNIEVLRDPAAEGAPALGVAVIAHPHPLFGGTMDNKVVQTLARAFVQSGWAALRFNFRGVGASEGEHDEGRGETDDMLALIAQEAAGGPLAVAGFSFGSYVATRALATLWPQRAIEKIVLVGTAASRFEVATLPADAHDRTLVVHGEVDDTVTVNDLPVALGEKNWLHYVTAKGSFVISFHSPGFLRQETEEISVKTEDVPMGNIRLIGGDVDGNGYIDASDRQYLIMVMGGDVITNADFDADPTIEATGGSRGDVLFGDDYLHADLNDDDTVNAIDLGIVLNGIGKSGN